jgi:hypothetical protein
MITQYFIGYAIAFASFLGDYRQTINGKKVPTNFGSIMAIRSYQSYGTGSRNVCGGGRILDSY